MTKRTRFQTVYLASRSRKLKSELWLLQPIVSICKKLEQQLLEQLKQEQLWSQQGTW